MEEKAEEAGITLSEAQIDAIAEKAAARVLDMMYREVGKNVLRKAAWTVGIVFASLLLWLAGNGHLVK